MKLKFNIKNKPFVTCIVLSLISMKFLSAVLMIIVLLVSATLAMDGFKKQAIYTSILSVICGIFGIIMGNFVAGLKDKLEMVTTYPSLVDNPDIVTKLHRFYNLIQMAQFGIIAVFIIIRGSMRKPKKFLIIHTIPCN